MTNPAAYWRNKKENFLYLHKTGTLVSCTQIHHPPKGFGKQAYWVGIIQLDSGEKTTGQLILEGNTPQNGAQVIGVVRKTRKADTESVIEYGVKFKVL